MWAVCKLPKIQKMQKQASLKDTLGVVTGGGSGIGAACCRELTQQGARVAVLDRNYESALKVAQELGGLAFECDIADDEKMANVAHLIEADMGPVSVLVNCAGIVQGRAGVYEMPMRKWDEIIRVDQRGTYVSCISFARAMLTRGHGSIVNIASVAGLHPTGSSIAYAVSKAGLIHLTRCMAVAMAPETLVNCVAPGLLEGTRATANLRAEQIQNSAASAVLKKAADKEDCADMVVTMCRTETMTGQTVVIDAGRVFH